MLIVFDTSSFRAYNEPVIKGIFSNKITRSFAIIIALFITAVLVLPNMAGCGGKASANTFTELLNLVPATVFDRDDNPVYFTLIDYASAYKEAGISFRTFEEFTDAIKTIDIEMWRDFPGLGSYITGYGRYAETSPVRDEYIGYEIGDVGAEIQFGAPPIQVVAAIGRFDPDKTKSALNNQSEWPEWAISDYATTEYNGVTIHSWGNGFQPHLESRLVPPNIDELGRARPLAVTDKYLFYAPTVETIKEMVDASRDTGKSLAGLKEYTSIATVFYDLKIYQVMLGESSLTNQIISHGKNTVPLSEEEKAEIIDSAGAMLNKFLTYGIGGGKDEKGVYTVIILYHENPGLAKENVSLFQQRIEKGRSLIQEKDWDEVFTETDISAGGNLVIAKLYGGPRMSWLQIFYSFDNLLIHEE